MTWTYRGFTGAGEAPDVLGKYQGKQLLVVGGARCVWDDLQKIGKWPHEVMVVNDIGAYLSWRVHHFASLHSEYLGPWLALRLGHNLGYGERPMTHSHKQKPGSSKVDVIWPLVNAGGLSGLFAAQIGLCMGYDRIIMAGCPTDGSGRFFDPLVARGTHGDPAVRMVWRDEINSNTELKNRVRSLSGKTREWLGEP